VAQVLSESRDAASKARRGAVIIAFTLAAALALERPQPGVRR
jgi:hypothetical protein